MVDRKDYLRILTIILCGMIFLKIISMFIIIFTPLGESSTISDFVKDIYWNYPEFWVIFNIPFPIIYIYLGVKRKVEKSYASYGALFSILQIPFGFFLCFLTIASRF